MLRIKNGLMAWYQSTQATGNLSLTDLSGNGRTLAQASTPPTLVSNVQNGKQGVYFDGSKNPLQWSGTFNGARHMFLVCSYEDAAFTVNNRGLLSDFTNAYLLSESSGTKFFDLSLSAAGYIYRKSDISYADNNQQAPVNNQIAVIEISFNTGATMDGIVIGQDRSDTTRRWKGYFLEALFYSVAIDEFAREQIYRHFAEEWALWRKTSAGLNIFPFPAEHSRAITKEKKVWASTPYDGDPTFLTRGNSKRKMEFTAEGRRPDEMRAADTFVESHFPSTKWVYRDYSVYPSVDTTYRFTSQLKEQGSGVGRLKSYAFTTEEA